MHDEEQNDDQDSPASAVPSPATSVRDRKLKKVRKIFSVSAQHLASLARVAPALISQVETGRRQLTDETREKICRALGIPDYIWGRPWLFEEVTFVHKKTYEEASTKVSGLQDVRPTRTWNMQGERWVAYNAHPTMVNTGCYKFLSMEEMQELEMPRRSSEPFSIFEGGAMQVSILDFEVHGLDRLVIDAHDGEEVIYVMEGQIDLAVMARPPQGAAYLPESEDLPFKRERYFSNRKPGEIQNVKMEVQALDIIRHEHPKLNNWLEQFSLIDDDIYPGRFCEVPCEVFHFGQGDIVRVNSKWPHGALASEVADQEGTHARGLFTVYGSYFGEVVQGES